MEHPYTVLIAEDHDIQRKMLVDFCTRANWSVVASVSSSLQVISEYLEHRPNLIILDINLSKSDGIAAMKKLKELGHEPFVIFVTGSLDPDHLKAGFALNTVDFITKPYRITDIEKALVKAAARMEDQRNHL